jgi:hypothetical protein
MSERDLKRIEVLTDVRAGRRTVAAAAVQIRAHFPEAAFLAGFRVRGQYF